MAMIIAKTWLRDGILWRALLGIRQMAARPPQGLLFGEDIVGAEFRRARDAQILTHGGGGGRNQGRFAPPRGGKTPGGSPPKPILLGKIFRDRAGQSIQLRVSRQGWLRLDRRVSRVGVRRQQKGVHELSECRTSWIAVTQALNGLF